MGWLTYAISLLILCNTSRALNGVWHWECIEGYCMKKVKNDNQTTVLSLSACHLSCSDAAAIWPKPTGEISIGNYLTKINIHSIDIEGTNSDSPIDGLVRAATANFKQDVKSHIPSRFSPKGGKSLVIKLDIQYPNLSELEILYTDESYNLKVSERLDGRIEALITAPSFFGARHGLQTLSQIIIFDDINEELQIPRDVFISDRPAYPYRGILLDTSRNYVDVPTIKRTLTAMGASKLNVFHWHITDSHSFPYVSKSRPQLAQYGAYTPSQIYDDKDVREIIEYGKSRGVRVMPEFDAPAHVGEGWQNTGLVTCLNWQPWTEYCVEPPCGQFDPTKAELYDVLEDIYGDLFDQFKPDIFHMGGDEINFNCWNSTSSIVDWMRQKGLNNTLDDFVKLWNYFQSNALERVYKKAGKKIPIIMWTSELTSKEYLLNSLPKDKYFIQIWTTETDEQITNLLENGYKIILSNYDALYLDCGFSGWVTDGNNWCAPYIGWQKVYNNSPQSIAGAKKNQVLGSEAALWTEQADSATIDSRLWPRAAALAETLWSEPKTSWQEAEQRFLIHRERLVRLGVNADAIEPQWCLHNEENCRKGSKFYNEAINKNNGKL